MTNPFCIDGYPLAMLQPRTLITLKDALQELPEDEKKQLEISTSHSEAEGSPSKSFSQNMECFVIDCKTDAVLSIDNVPVKFPLEDSERFFVEYFNTIIKKEPVTPVRSEKKRENLKMKQVRKEKKRRLVDSIGIGLPENCNKMQNYGKNSLSSNLSDNEIDDRSPLCHISPNVPARNTRSRMQKYDRNCQKKLEYFGSKDKENVIPSIKKELSDEDDVEEDSELCHQYFTNMLEGGPFDFSEEGESEIIKKICDDMGSEELETYTVECDDRTLSVLVDEFGIRNAEDDHFCVLDLSSGNFDG